jgi:hypothetical protein
LKELTIRIVFDYDGGYKGHDEVTVELIREMIEKEILFN